MRWILGLIAFSILLCGCSGSAEKAPEKQVKEQPAGDDVLPENLGDPNAPTQIRALQGAKQDRDLINAQHKEDSKVLKESD